MCVRTKTILKTNFYSNLRISPKKKKKSQLYRSAKRPDSTNQIPKRRAVISNRNNPSTNNRISSRRAERKEK